MIDGKQYTSNNDRLLKNLDTLDRIQKEQPNAPVMVHLSLTNNCELNCSYCCYGSREKGIELPYDKAISAIRQFAGLGTKGLEITGGGEPARYKRLEDIVSEAKNLGMDVGLITNGMNTNDHSDMYKNLQWMRVSLHGINLGDYQKKKMGETIDKAREENPNIDLSSVYIWNDKSNKLIQEVADFTDDYKLPTRVTPDLTLGRRVIDDMMPHIREHLHYADGKYLFLSDFNVKTDREHDHCYMHQIKPFVFTDGNVYDCPSLGLSPDNNLNINDKFKVCSIEGILDHYWKPAKPRELDCKFCKYAQQNEFIHDLKKPMKHNNFA